MRTQLVMLGLVAACGAAPARVEPAPTVAAVDSEVATRVPVAPPPPNPLVAADRPVTDAYHGVAVVDHYQWLEADDDAVRAWSAAQNTKARAVLDHLPEIDAIRRELHDIFAAPGTTYTHLAVGGGQLFGFRKQATHEQPELVVMADPGAPADAKLIFDPAAAGGAQQTIDWMRPAPDGTKVAVSLSVGGSEAGALHIMDLSGKDLEPPIPGVQHGTGGGDVAWTPDSKGLYYTRYPAAGEKPEAERDAWVNVWFHALGTAAASDHYEMGKDLPKIAEIQLAADARGRVIASVQDGDGGIFRHYLKDKAGWRQLDDWQDHIVAVQFGAGDDLWLVSRAGAPRGKILKLSARAKTAAAAVVVVPEGKDAIVTDFEPVTGVVATADRLFAVYQLGGPTEIRAFTLAGKPAKAPPQPPIASVTIATRWKTGLIVGGSTYTTPFAYSWFDPARGTVRALGELSPPAPVDLSGFEVTRAVATSKDGTAVPLNILWPKGAPKDGTTPCVVTGYGGFGISLEPSFVSGWAPLLRRGVCFVEANLRGGGELGEAWHQGGMTPHKQNVFDDFAAALQWVIVNKLTSPGKLGIFGGSNGGLLMGAMLTQHPELVRAVVAWVGIYDALRYELSPNGAYNVTEYGSVADEAQFQALYAYSPYHHVTPRAYPATLMSTGANDPRVSPWQSRKMIAALEAAQTGVAPILLRTSDKAGHGMGSSMTERIALRADQIAFLLAQLR